MVFLAAAAPAPASSGPYARTIRRTEQALARRDYSAAETLLRGLRKKYPDNQEVLALLVRDYCARGTYSLAERQYRTVPPVQRKPELATAARQCRTRRAFDQARDALARGAPERAIAIAAPLYRAGTNPYRAGLIMASAYLRLGRIAKAAALYAELQRHYPRDAELASEAQRLGEIAALGKAKRLLSLGDTREAVAQAKPIYDNHDATFRTDAGILLAKAYEASGDTARALEIYRSLLATDPANATLRKRYSRMRDKALLARVNGLMTTKEYPRAISLLEPRYDAAHPDYGIGMALAAAYMRSRKPAKAASVYQDLQATYPQDREFPALRLRALLAARRYPEASRIYASLDTAGKKVLTNSLGDEARHLYLYSASAGAQLIKDSNGYPNEQLYEIRVKAVTQAGTFVGHLQSENRFNLSARNYRLDYYYHLTQGWYGYLSYAHSPQHTFLADNDYTLALNKNLGLLTVLASVRHLAFTQTSATVYFGGVGFNATPGLHLITGVFYVPQTSGYSVMLEPIWYLGNGEAYAYLTAGQIGEQLNVSGGVKRAASYAIRVGRRLDITPRFGVSMEAFFEHRANLYNRTGIGLYLTWRW